jgi:hypothetical protein
MESEEWLEAEPMMKAQSDKIPDGLTTPELLERQRDPFSSFPFTNSCASHKSFGFGIWICTTAC